MRVLEESPVSVSVDKICLRNNNIYAVITVVYWNDAYRLSFDITHRKVKTI